LLQHHSIAARYSMVLHVREADLEHQNPNAEGLALLTGIWQAVNCSSPCQEIHPEEMGPIKMPRKWNIGAQELQTLTGLIDLRSMSTLSDGSACWHQQHAALR
jgi:hypothetical protein